MWRVTVDGLLPSQNFSAWNFKHSLREAGMLAQCFPSWMCIAMTWGGILLKCRLRTPVVHQHPASHCWRCSPLWATGRPTSPPHCASRATPPFNGQPQWKLSNSQYSVPDGTRDHCFMGRLSFIQISLPVENKNLLKKKLNIHLNICYSHPVKLVRELISPPTSNVTFSLHTCMT